MKLVIIHSRFIHNRKSMMGAGIGANRDNETRIDYARAAINDSANRGEDPIAFHLLYTDVLYRDVVSNTNQLTSRDLCEQLGYHGTDSDRSWWKVADMHAFYTDQDWDSYMLEAEDMCRKHGYPHELRSLRATPIASRIARENLLRPI